MNRRGKRLTLWVAAMGLAVVLALAIAHWSTVRDHAEAWYFQMTTETRTIDPDLTREVTWKVGLDGSTVTFASETDLSRWMQMRKDGQGFLYPSRVDLFCVLADDSRYSVIFAQTQDSLDDLSPVLTADAKTMRAIDALQILKADGYRVLEQRFPRRAWVIIRTAHAAPEAIDEGWRQNFLDEVLGQEASSVAK